MQARGLDVVRTVEPSLVVAMWPPVVAPAVRETNGAMMPRRAALREPEARVVTSLPSDGLHLPENGARPCDVVGFVVCVVNAILFIVSY